MARRISAGAMRCILNLWPPFLFAGIRVTRLGDDYRHARVELRQHWYNRNYVGTHFGGSLFSMTDPFWMLMTLHCLGPGYIVWDKAGEIDFRKPGRGRLSVEFHLDEAITDAIDSATAGGDKYLHWFETPVIDDDGDIVALVRKQIYVRRKQASIAAG